MLATLDGNLNSCKLMLYKCSREINFLRRQRNLLQSPFIVDIYTMRKGSPILASCSECAVLRLRGCQVSTFGSSYSTWENVQCFLWQKGSCLLLAFYA